MSEEVATVARGHRRVRAGLRKPGNWLQLLRFGLVGASGYAVNLAVFAGQHAATPIRAVYVAGPGDNGLADRLREALPLPVHGFDPTAGSPSADILPAPLRGRFAGPVGLLALRAISATLPINFTQPRQPRAEPGKQRSRVLIGVLAGATTQLGLGAIVTQNIRLQGVTVGSRELFEDMARAMEVHGTKPPIDEQRCASGRIQRYARVWKWSY